MKKTGTDLRDRAEQVLRPLEQWRFKCHEASITLVCAGIGTRVARGGCAGVGSQHSWVVVGNDCYAKNAEIIDPTLWSYNSKVKGIWVGTAAKGWHRPHGMGLIWDWGRPQAQGGTVVPLDPKIVLSEGAQAFLDLIGPLDFAGWGMLLSHAPVGGWPAKEIVTAAYKTAKLKAVTPIDRVGMLTDLNPGGLYLRE